MSFNSSSSACETVERKRLEAKAFLANAWSEQRQANDEATTLELENEALRLQVTSFPTIFQMKNQVRRLTRTCESLDSEIHDLQKKLAMMKHKSMKLLQSLKTMAKANTTKSKGLSGEMAVRSQSLTSSALTCS
jgi:hypothetical protein